MILHAPTLTRNIVRITRGFMLLVLFLALPPTLLTGDTSASSNSDKVSTSETDPYLLLNSTWVRFGDLFVAVQSISRDGVDVSSLASELEVARSELRIAEIHLGQNDTTVALSYITLANAVLDDVEDQLGVLTTGEREQLSLARIVYVSVSIVGILVVFWLSRLLFKRHVALIREDYLQLEIDYGDETHE